MSVSYVSCQLKMVKQLNCQHLLNFWCLINNFINNSKICPCGVLHSLLNLCIKCYQSHINALRKGLLEEVIKGLSISLLSKTQGLRFLFSLLFFSLKSLFAAPLPGKVAIINGVLSLFTSEQQVDLNSWKLIRTITNSNFLATRLTWCMIH